MNTKKLISAVLASAICFTYAVSPTGYSDVRVLAVNTENIGSIPVIADNAAGLGDVDSSSTVDAADASVVLGEYSILSTGGTSKFTAAQKKSADVNKDGAIDSSDASYILAYYAYLSTGGSKTMEEYMGYAQPVTTTTTAKVTTTKKKTTTTTAKKTTVITDLATTTKKPSTTQTTTTTTMITTTTTTVTNAKVSSIRVTRNEMIVNVGEGDLSAYVTMLPANALNKSEIWSSSDESIAVVDNEGWVIGVSEGECTVTVKSADNPQVFAEIKVTVKNTRSVRDIRLSRESMTLKVGTGDLAARVTMLPDTAVNKKEIWTSSQPDVASVDDEGWVVGHKAGNTIITVKSEDNPAVFGVILVTVTDDAVTTVTTTATTTTTTVPPVTTTTTSSIDVEEIKFGDSEVTLEAGTSYVPILAISPLNATNKTLVWASSNNSVATVSEKGVITAVGEGTCYVTVSSASNPAVMAVAIINVTNSTSTVTEIKLSKYEMKLSVGSSDISIVTMLPVDAENKEEFWTSSDISVATVDEMGWVYGVGKGECIVTVYSMDNHNVKAEIKVTVTDEPVEPPVYTFSQIAPGKSTAKEIAFLTPFPANANGLFIFDYFITDANGNKRLVTTSVIDSADVSKVITMLTANTNHFTAELYVTNLNTSKRAKIGVYNFVINPRNALTEEEAIENAFAAVGGLK
ncbi:MAG: Ig-like domain-containing protein [Ruminococcus sp.]|nr:Ig-like domain-containing protein [Ruminococcus sp.]